MTAFSLHAEPAAKAPKKGAALEEVVVTAQRREESAQDVPISVTVFSQDDLSKANVTNASDLAIYTPSLNVNATMGSENATFSLRGFSQTVRTASTVATYFAEVVAPRGAVAQPSGDGAGPGYFFDLQNVQVLKGPQGTLFGRNTTGGAVLLVPNRPEDEFGGSIELSAGSEGATGQRLVLNMPITDDFKLRLSVDNQQRDGFLKNIGDIGPDTLADVDYTTWRLGVLWDLSDKLENYTIVNYVDSENAGYAGKVTHCNPDPSYQFYALTGRACEAQLAEEKATGKDGYYNVANNVKTATSIIKEKRVINATTWNAFENASIKAIVAYAHLETWRGSNVFGPHFKETYLTGVDLSSLSGITSAVGTSLTQLPVYDERREFAFAGSMVIPGRPVASQETWVGELRAEGLSFDGRLTWQTGLYYEDSTPDGESGNTTAALLYCDISTLETLDTTQYNCFDPLGGALGGVLNTALEYTFLSKGIYGQITYDISEKVSTTLGLRYTEDTAEGRGLATLTTFNGVVANAPKYTRTNPEVSSSAPTGVIEFDYRPFEDAVMLYAKYVRGYRQGGVNMNADSGLDVFNDETVDNYEIGAKTQFGGPVPGRFNISFFANDLTDMQIQTGYVSPNYGPTSTIGNAGKGKINGVEIEAMFLLTEDLRLSISYSKLDTELVKKIELDSQAVSDAVLATTNNPAQALIASQTVSPTSDEGDELPYTADQSWVASLNYRVPVPESIGSIDLGATYVYTGKIRTSGSSTSPYDVLPDFYLLNLNASWLDIMGTNLDFTVFGTNVLDEEYLTFSAGIYNSVSFEIGHPGQPRMVGATLRYSF